ncbi:MAG: DUF1080 domain-containing protein [Pedosphaera sp.]|nr:DUF1080 domain-containing protein [Pedosphaera sp.]
MFEFQKTQNLDSEVGNLVRTCVHMNRRTFLKSGSAAVAGFSLLPRIAAGFEPVWGPFRISLSECSLVHSLKKNLVQHLDFPRIAKRDFSIDCVELADSFFLEKVSDKSYLQELRNGANAEGVRIGLLMLETNGRLASADASERQKAIATTKLWLDAATALNCLTVRTKAVGDGTPDELSRRLGESCSVLADHAALSGLNLVIENHGGVSSDPAWLAALVKSVNKSNFGLMPDFGSFPDAINRYEAVEQMMPFAKAVSAKATKFGTAGLVEDTDFFKMMRVVRDGGYRSYVGIESSVNSAEGEYEAIRTTRDLLRWIHGEETRCKEVFNGQNLLNWIKLEGGDWTVEDELLVGRNGINWTTNPEKSGSWLCSRKAYGDFRLELQFMINKGGKSGVFFHSAQEKNPAFTGYEFQIYDAPEKPPTKTGPGSIYEVLAPSKNALRPAGQWNTLTLTAVGAQVMVDVNFIKTIDAELPRSQKGYIGLQNHDAKSEVKFRNIRLEEL